MNSEMKGFFIGPPGGAEWNCEETYQKALQISLLLSHKSVQLGYFEFVQHRVKACKHYGHDFVTSVEQTHNIKIKRNKKKRALRGKQRVVLLMNSVGKRTVILLIHSFFYFFNPFFVTCNF